MNNLFRDWPADNIAQIYSSSKYPDFRICSNYWYFPQIRIVNKSGFPVSAKSASGPTKDRIIVSSILGRITPFIRSDINRDLSSLIDIWPFKITPPFIDWLLEFNPDVVYTWLGSNSIIKLVGSICKKFEILFVPHFLDDWLTTNSQRLWFSYLQSKRFKKNLQYILKYCNEGICISELMAREYSKRYGIKMNVVANGIEDRLLDELKIGLSDRETSGELFRFSLLGRLEYSRIRLVYNFIEAVQKLDHSTKTIVLSIYSTTEIPSVLLGRHGNMIVQSRRPLPDQQMRLLQKETDCLLYLDDFNTMSRRYFRLSMSSKIPLYLSLGRPILTIGPSDVNSVIYLTKCDVGPVVTESSIDAISHAVKQLIEGDIQTRLCKGQRAWGIAEQAHRNKKERDSLYNILNRNRRSYAC